MLFRPLHVPVSQANVVVEFTNSKKTVNAVVGSPLSQLCAKNGIKVMHTSRLYSSSSSIVAAEKP